MHAAIHGQVATGWGEVRRVFEENFTARGEVGAAVCVWHDGKVVADLWGGQSDPRSGTPWREDTLAVVMSTTKGVVASCLMALIDRGELELDRPVAAYWPEFGTAGKEHITVRQLLNHRSGLSAVVEPLTLEDFADHDKVSRALVAQHPLWIPGTDQGYMGTTFGMYAGQLFRRVAGTTVGQFLASELAGPLGADVHLGLTDSHQHRVCWMITADRRTVLTRMVPELTTRRTAEGRLFRRVLLARTSLPHLAFANPDMGPERLGAVNRPEVRQLELPWMGAVASARGLAQIYGALAAGGTLDGVRVASESTLARYLAVESWSPRDRVLQKPMGFTLGFLKDEPHLVSPFPEALGHTGAGGSVGFADPPRRLAFGYVMNRMDWRLRSPRGIALAHAAYRCVGVEMETRRRA